MPYQYDWLFDYTVTNASGKEQILSSVTIAIDEVEYGYYKTGHITLTLDGETFLDTEVTSITSGSFLNGISAGDIGKVWPAGGVMRIVARVTSDGFIQDTVRGMSIPPGFTVQVNSGHGNLTHMGFSVVPLEAPPPTGGGTGGVGTPGNAATQNDPAKIEGMIYQVSPPHDCWATVTRWQYPPLFGVKVLTPPPPPAQLFYPTTAGPNYEGTCSGLLLTPAVIYGIKDRDTGQVKELEAAGVKFKLSAGDISSAVAVGILPFKE